MDTTRLLLETAERVFRDHCDKPLLDAAEAGEFPTALWQVVTEQGLDQVGLPDSGAEFGDLYRILKVAGYHAVPLPLTEALVANRVIGDAARLRSIATVLPDRPPTAPWGRAVDEILIVGGEGARVATGVAAAGVNLAGEPRDLVSVQDARPVEVVGDDPIIEWLTLGRAVQMAGVLTRLLELSVQYAIERQQFGRPIAKFQAIQHMLAVMAGEVAAASRAADAAINALEGDRLSLEVAVAKSRIGEAAGVVAEQAHQVHGAMGFTHEHQLHHFTRRAWAWRDEYATESDCQVLLGEHLGSLGADQLWDFVATRG